MAPIYDTDLAEERFSQSSWNHYELWEKVEGRVKRRKRLWVVGTILLFLVLSSIPIILDRWPKWVSLSACRSLAQEINRVKREAALSRSAFRIRFAQESGDGHIRYSVEKIPSCANEAPGEIVRHEALRVGGSDASFLALVGPDVGRQFGVEGLTNSFCYDPILGSGPFSRGETLVGFGVIPAKDLTEQRLDRLSVLVLNGQLAELSFE